MFLPSVEGKLVFRHEEEAAIFTELGQNSLPFAGYKVDKFWGSCVYLLAFSILDEG